jgi:hypothetical protein
VKSFPNTCGCPWAVAWQDAGERERERERENRKDAAAVSSCSPLPCDTANDFLCEILNVTAADIVVLFPWCHRAYLELKKKHNYGPN